MENQTITITLEEYKSLRDVCEGYVMLTEQYKHLHYLYTQQCKAIAQYETYLYGDVDDEVEIKKNPIGFKTK